MAGRPSKKRDATKEAVLTALRSGNTRTAASAAVGVDRHTLARWIAEDAPFRAAVEKAEAEAEKKMLGVIETAAYGGTWQAAAWWLERRRRDDYAVKQINQIEGNPEAPLTVVIGERRDGPQ